MKNIYHSAEKKLSNKKGNVMKKRSGKNRMPVMLTLTAAVIAGILFWQVRESVALKVNRTDDRVRADKKTKLSLLKEWQEKNTPLVPGVLVVKFKSGVSVTKETATTSQPLLNAQLQRAGVKKLTPVVSSIKNLSSVNAKYRLDHIYYAELQSGANEYLAAETLTKDISVEYAEPKRMHYISYAPNDPLYAGAAPGPQNGYFDIMKVTQGWDIVRADSSAGGLIPKSSRVIIAVVDGGTMWEHQDLTANLWINPLEDINGNYVFDNFSLASGGDLDGIDQDGNGYTDDVIGWNFANNNSNPRGNAGTPNSADHGTACGSYFGAVTNNSLGMSGTAFNPRLMPVCAAHPSADNAISYGYEGILYAADNGASVISCSWGGVGGYSNFEQDVINAVSDAGSLVLGAAGNGGSDGIGDNNDLTPNYPSNYKRVLAVGATSKTTDAKASFSNYGTTVPVYAVGSNVVSCVDQAGGATYQSSGWSGTSMSTPMVAGLAGLLKTKNPAWTPDQIRTQIRVTSDSIDAANPSLAGKLGHGRVNFYRALTESRPGLDMISSQALTPSGENVIFLPGDTIFLTALFKNVLHENANNVTITVTPSGSQVTLIQNPPVISSIPVGSQKSMSPAVLRVSPSLTAIANVFLKISVSAAGNYSDAFGITITVYPSLPNWSSQVSPVGSLLSVKAVNSNVAWAVGNGGAIIRTTDGGTNWEVINSGIIGTQDLYNVTALDSDTAYTTSTPTTTTYIYRTTNGGTSWQQVFTQSGGFINAIHMFDATNGIAQGDPVGGKWTILRTNNGGAAWYRIATEPTPATGEAGWNNSMQWIGTMHGWFGTNKTKIWRTIDGGGTWQSAATTGITSTTSVSFSDVNNGLAGNGDNASKTTYMRTTNGGAAWFSGALPAATTAHTVAYAPGSSYAWSATASGKMYRSVANSTTLSWQTQMTPAISGTVTDFSIADTSNGWAVTSAGEILEVGAYVAAPLITSMPDTLVSVNNLYRYNIGASGIPVPVYRLINAPVGMTIDSVSGVVSWTPSETGDFGITVNAVNNQGIASQSYILHVVTSTGIGDLDNGQPKKFELSQNFPNPFNPSTSIRYSVKDQSKVTITIYNLLGQEVRTLVNEIQTPGFRQVIWNGKDDNGRAVSSGVYLYRLRAGDFVQSRKMLLMK